MKWVNIYSLGNSPSDSLEFWVPLHNIHSIEVNYSYVQQPNCYTVTIIFPDTVSAYAQRVFYYSIPEFNSIEQVREAFMATFKPVELIPNVEGN